MDQYSNSNSGSALPLALPQSSYHTSSAAMPAPAGHGPGSFSDTNTAAHSLAYNGPSIDSNDVMHLGFKGGAPVVLNSGAGPGSGNSSLSNNQGRQKFSELGFSVINEQHSATQLGSANAATNQTTESSRGKYGGRPTGIPRISQGSRILKFQGMRANDNQRSNDRLSNAGMQVMAIQERHRQSSAQMNTVSGSSSHLENKKEVKDFITKIPGIKGTYRPQPGRQMQQNPSEQELRMKDGQQAQRAARSKVAPPSSTQKQATKKYTGPTYDYNHDFKAMVDVRQQRGRHSGSINLSPHDKNARGSAADAHAGSGDLYKYSAVARKHSGSQSRIPIFKGTHSPARSVESGGSSQKVERRSSSLSNYQGRIPRLKSNERLTLLQDVEQEAGRGAKYAKSGSAQSNSQVHPPKHYQKTVEANNQYNVGLRISMGSRGAATKAPAKAGSRVSRLSDLAQMGPSSQVAEAAGMQIKNQKTLKQVTHNILKPKAQTIRQGQYRANAPNAAGQGARDPNLLPSRRISARPRHSDLHKGSNLDNHLRKLELKKFGDDQLSELAYLQLQEAKKRLRHFVINTDMRSDPKEKRRLLGYFRHRSHTLITILKECFKARKGGQLALKAQSTQQCQGGSELGNPDREAQKVFQLNTKKHASENLTQEKVDQRALEAIEIFRKEHNVDPSKKIFVVLGQYQDMRDALAKKHGWVENPIENFDNPNDYRVHAFHFVYTTKSRDAFKYQTASFQQINHFEGTKSLTTKVGLTHNMKNLVWQHDMDINEVFPQSYDLTDKDSEEFKDFLAEMKFGQLVACLKSAMNMSQQSLQKNMDRIVVSIGYVDRRIRLMSEELLSAHQQIILPGQNNELDVISDDIYYFVQGKSGGQQDFSKMPWFLKLQKQNALLKDISPKNAKERISALLAELRAAMGETQYALYGTKNAWIVKPGGKSRGRGIQIHTSKDNLNNYIRSSMDKIWVTQKYIESPLIIKQKKFDIRQWVCVTSWKPVLEIWFYTDMYLRFTSDNYDPNQLNNKFANLTNATINKENIKADNSEDKEFNSKMNLTDAEEIDKLRIRGNMWTNQQFELYLNKLTAAQGAGHAFPNGPYQDKIYPLLKQGVIASILATRNTIVQNEPFLSHEIFGYDFMVDTSFNVWLIEVNSSPSMEYSSAITERYVKEGLWNLADIAMEQERSLRGAPWNHTVGSRIGKFELIYQSSL